MLTSLGADAEFRARRARAARALGLDHLATVHLGLQRACEADDLRDRTLTDGRRLLEHDRQHRRADSSCADEVHEHVTGQHRVHLPVGWQCGHQILDLACAGRAAGRRIADRGLRRRLRRTAVSSDGSISWANSSAMPSPPPSMMLEVKACGIMLA